MEKPAEIRPDRRRGESPRPAPRPPAETPARVLLVDDEVVIRKLFDNLLVPPEFEVTTFEDAEAALAAYRPGTFDLAIVDKNLPGQSGLDLLRALKAREPLLEVMVMTGYASLQTAIEALQLGAYDYLEKPFADIDIVVEKARRAVQRRHLALTNVHLVTSLQQTNLRLTERNVELLETQEELLRQLRLASVGQLAALVGTELSEPVAGIKSNTYVLDEALGPAESLLRTLAETAQAASAGETEAPLQVLRALAEGRSLDAARDAAHEARQMLREMKEEIERLVGMIKAMQVFSAQGRLEPRPIDLRSCVERALELSETQRRRLGVALRLDLPDELPLVPAAPLLVTQAWVNILQNALEAVTSEGLVEVRVRHEEGRVSIVVSDTGCGIPRAELGRVLRPFYTTKEAARHLGLGLNLAQELVRRQGGALRLESEPGTGTRVLLSFPSA